MTANSLRGVMGWGGGVTGGWVLETILNLILEMPGNTKHGVWPFLLAREGGKEGLG